MLPYPVGETDIHKKQFLILPEQKRRHIGIFGKSGVGKSTLLQNMITWDIHEGLGVSVIDPHGSLIEEVLRTIPRRRTSDVIYFSPKDPHYALGINILESVSDEQKPLITSSLVSIFRTLFSHGWGARSEDLLRHSIFALMEQPVPYSLIAIPKLLTDADFRKRIVENVENPPTLRFFATYDNQWDKRFREEAIAPLLNKLDAFITNPLLRSIIGQTKSGFQFREAIDTNKILLCDLSKGALGEDVSSLLGSLIVTKLSLAALSRQDTPEEDRTLHVLYADEIQNFIHGVDFPTILAESRKYKLALNIATQTLSQLPRECLSAVFGNCGTIISFRVSGEDAGALQEEFATLLPARLLQDLPDYKIYIRTLINDGTGTTKPNEPQLVNAMPPLPYYGSNDPQRIINTSLQRFARPRAEVEAKLKKFLSN